ncbi:MAG: cell division protein FtsL [Hyphomicrobiaceae bacterium]
MRLLTLSSVLMALSSAFLLYALNDQTRRLEEQVAAQERALVAGRRDLSVLKAERAHLARPERIGPLARELGLVDPRAHQFVDFGAPADITTGDISRTQ